MKLKLKCIIFVTISYVLTSVYADKFCLSPPSDLKNVKYHLNSAGELVKELEPYYNESLYDQNLKVMENRELSVIITHVNSKHDPYKNALSNTELIIKNANYSNIYEHTVPWSKSHISHDLKEVIFQEEKPYFIEGLEGNSFVIIGGGKSYCHYHAFENLIKQLQDKGRNRFEVHFPYPAIYLSYYEPGDEEIGNVLLNSPMESGRVVTLFKRDMKRITDFQDYYDFLIENKINFTIHNDNGEDYTFIINEAKNAISIDIYLWNTIESMFDFMDGNQVNIKFKRRNTPDLLRFFTKNIRYWLEVNKRLFSINTTVLLKNTLRDKKNLFKEAYISNLLEEVIDDIDSIQIFEFLDSLTENHHGNYYIKLGSDNFILNELNIDELQSYAISFFVYRLSSEIRNVFNLSIKEYDLLNDNLLSELYDNFQNGKTMEYYTKPISPNMVFKGFFSLNFLKQRFDFFKNCKKIEKEIINLFAYQLKKLHTNIVVQDIAKENRAFAYSA